jgi:hypothetical protein
VPELVRWWVPLLEELEPREHPSIVEAEVPVVEEMNLKAQYSREMV